MSYLSLKVIEHVCVHCGVCVCVGLDFGMVVSPVLNF